jgi:hypothetical protein
MRAIAFPVSLGAGFSQVALLPRGGVPVDQAFASRTVEQADSGQPLVGGRSWRFCLLECGPQRRALRAIARGGSPGFAHIFLCGLNVWHSPQSYPAPIAHVKMRHYFDV